jgi:hypothetical protein
MKFATKKANENVNGGKKKMLFFCHVSYDQLAHRNNGFVWPAELKTKPNLGFRAN